MSALIAEGLFVGVNRGDCPLGPLQERVGDPIPLFELVLSPRTASARCRCWVWWRARESRCWRGVRLPD